MSALPRRKRMRWWIKAIIASAVLSAIIIAAGIVHTDVILKGRITKEQDSKISGVYGNITAVALVLVWIVAYQTRKKDGF